MLASNNSNWHQDRMYNANDGDETQSDFTYAESGADEQTADQSKTVELVWVE